MAQNIQTFVNVSSVDNIHSQAQYQSAVTTAKLGSRVIRLKNLTPILSPKQREEREREIESRLYDVFIKYVDKIDK